MKSEEMDPILANTPAGVNGEKGDFRQAQSSTEQFAVPPGETGMDTIYFGFPLVSNHTHFELTHKVELYSAYIAYKFFLQDELKKK